MKNKFNFFKPVKVNAKPLFSFNKPKSSAVNLSTYPKRSKQENRLIDKNPWGDRDKDRVINIFDCKPLNKRKQSKFYHGTSSLFGWKIKQEGIKPSKKLPSNQKMSDKTEGEYTYVFEKPHHAHTWAQTVSQRVGMGKPEVLEVDIPEKELERDVEMPYGEAWKKKGDIPAKHIKEFKGDVSYPSENKNKTEAIKTLSERYKTDEE